GRVERFGDLQGDVERCADGQRPALDQACEAFARDVLHSDERQAIRLPKLINGGDVRMVERGGGLRFFEQALLRAVVRAGLLCNEFQRDDSIQSQVNGFVDFAHSALPDSFDEAVMSHFLSEASMYHQPTCWIMNLKSRSSRAQRQIAEKTSRRSGAGAYARVRLYHRQLSLRGFFSALF